jgi:predicted DNA-binding protein (MmcQ/YjbR family)
MQFDIIRNYCLGKPEVVEDFPFGPDVIVWKVCGKMFCLGNIGDFVSINLKCDPEYALKLREQFEQVRPGYHMNKTQWNTVYFDGIREKDIFAWIDHSYNEVVQKLPKKLKERILHE